MLSLALSVLALAGAATAQNTQTSVAAVHAAQATASTSSPVTHVPGAMFDRFVTIWLENTDYSTAMADPNMQWIREQGVLLSNYFGVTHPSEPNYVASIGGDNFGMDNDNLNFIPSNVSTVVDLLEARGVSWGEYQEDMPYSGFEGYSWINQTTHANDYVRKHNPAILYNANTNKQRLSQIKNLTMFYEDLEKNTLPQWMFITPNMTDDGHDTSVTVAGLWSRNFLAPLLTNKKFMKNTLVLLTFDENHTYSEPNRVMSILLGDAVPKKLVNSTDANFYDHYSEIATVEANWGMNTLGRWDVGANVFQMVADKTGDLLTEWPAITGDNPTRFLNSSYPGMFNSENNTVGIPTPNIYAMSPETKNHDKQGQRSVLPQIIGQYANGFSGSIYNVTIEIPDGSHPPMGY